MKRFYNFTVLWFQYIEWIFLFATLWAIVEKSKSYIIAGTAAISYLLLLTYALYKYLDWSFPYFEKSKYKGLFKIASGAIIFMLGNFLWHTISKEILNFISR